eukprot:12174602-Alexandrium_andersonii.AAC.1
MSMSVGALMLFGGGELGLAAQGTQWVLGGLGLLELGWLGGGRQRARLVITGGRCHHEALGIYAKWRWTESGTGQARWGIHGGKRGRRADDEGAQGGESTGGHGSD